MNNANKLKCAFQCFFIIVVMMFVAACKTTSTVSSSGTPGAPEAPGTAGLPGTGDTPGTPGAPTPGTISLPSPQPGSQSGRPGDASSAQSGSSGDASSAQSGEGESPAASRSASGTGQHKTDDEILAEALEEFGRTTKPAQQGGRNENTGGPLPRAGAGNSRATAAEKREVLNKELGDKFAKFDSIMLNEQESINKRANQEGQGGFPGEDIPGEGGTAEDPLQTAMVDEDPVSLKGQGNKPARDRSEVPPDLVDAEGDDIIARQLREAAMKEKDPELRAKLWDEYRKYKRDLR